MIYTGEKVQKELEKEAAACGMEYLVQVACSDTETLHALADLVEEKGNIGGLQIWQIVKNKRIGPRKFSMKH